jgi:acetoin utilization deacetylase AcuC-like enzyme
VIYAAPHHISPDSLFQAPRGHHCAPGPAALKAFHADHVPLVLPPGHGFPAGKHRRLRDRIEGWPGLDVHAAEPAGDEVLALAHDPAYVAAVAQGGLSAAEQRAIGFPWSEAMVARARRSVGATLAAARTALAEGVACNLAGGTHHASAGRGSGYCVFNDVAVAARAVQGGAARDGFDAQVRERGDALPRIVVVDLDVHQGDGTASIFAGDASVFTLSLHGEKNFPFRKAASDLDVGLPDGCGDADYLAALDAALAVVRREHAARPFGLAFYLAGADPHENDRLGRLKLSAEGLLERDRRVLAALRERRIPVALAMAGGYGHDIEVTVAIQAATIGAAMASWREWKNARP